MEQVCGVAFNVWFVDVLMGCWLRCNARNGWEYTPLGDFRRVVLDDLFKRRSLLDLAEFSFYRYQCIFPGVTRHGTALKVGIICDRQFVLSAPFSFW